MYTWKIEYLPGNSVGRFKVIASDMVRNCVTTGNTIFCDEKDKKGANDYTPKFILAKGTYLSIQRMEPSVKEGMKAKKETKTETVEWLDRIERK